MRLGGYSVYQREYSSLQLSSCLVGMSENIRQTLLLVCIDKGDQEHPSTAAGPSLTQPADIFIIQV